MNTLLTSCVGIVVLAIVTLPGRAITVGNYDFSIPSANGGYFFAPGASQGNPSVAVDDWTFSDPESVGGLQYSSSVPTVNQDAFFNNTEDNNSAFPLNTLTYSGTGADALPTIQSNTDYTLTVALGVPGISAASDYVVSLLANGNAVATATVDSDNFGLPGSGTTETPGYPAGTFFDLSVTLSGATIAAEGLANDQLGIQLGSQEVDTASASDASQTYFSDVRLSAAPEPSTFAMVALVGGMSGLMLIRRGRVAAKV